MTASPRMTELVGAYGVQSAMDGCADMSDESLSTQKARAALLQAIAEIESDTARLDWASNNPEAFYGYAGVMWATVGRGYREGYFNWRDTIDSAKQRADAARSAEGKA